ncbi:MAG: NYN domain-containing protein [Inhella sp.]
MYLYIDSAYFRRVMADQVQAVLGVSATPFWPAVRQFFRASRVFVYECLHDLQRDGEQDEAFKARVSAQECMLKSIGLVDGFFLRRGSLRGTANRPRQKEIDVLLAVDLLTHAHRKAASLVTLVAGDLDFKPVVEAVVDLGVRVTVAYETKSGAVDLALAADRS